MLLLNNKPFITLDNYLDIERFLKLKDEFYYTFCNNLSYSKASWNAGGVEVDSEWDYLMRNPYLYHALHNVKDDPYVIKLEDNKPGLCKYLQLKYNAFNPYTFMHLGEKNKGFHSFVSDNIQQWGYSLPFERLDLVSVLFNEHYVPLKYHRDFNFFPYEEGDNREVPSDLQDVIWLRFDLTRDLFLYDFDPKGNVIEKAKFEGYSINFNHYNWHGNTEVNDTCTMTIKVEGKFTEEFKEKIYV